MTNDVETRGREHESVEEKRAHVIHYFVDRIEESAKRSLTVGEILKKAGFNPAEYYLLQIRGKEEIPHKDAEKVIELHEGEHFVAIFTGATPLS